MNITRRSLMLGAAATVPLVSTNCRSAISSRRDERATVTFMSMRSSNGPESLPR